MMLDQKLLDILVCPKCKGDLTYDEAGSSLTCHVCHLEYEVRDGIPILLIDEAKSIPAVS